MNEGKASSGPSNISAFLSYSRRDGTQAEAISAILKDGGLEVFQDKSDILPAEDWQARIRQLIEAADTFIFLASRLSATSEECLRELRYALALKKRVIPITLEDPDSSWLPAQIGELNLIHWLKTDDDATICATVMTAALTDISWVREHTRLTEASKRWYKKTKPKQLLLKGVDLSDAETWRDAAGSSIESITQEHREYISASRSAASKRKRQWVVGTCVVSITLLGLALFSYFKDIEASEQLALAQINESKQQAALANDLATSGQGLEAILTSWMVLPHDDETAERPIVSEAVRALWEARYSLRQLHTLAEHEGAVYRAIYSPAGDIIATISQDQTAKLWSTSNGEELTTFVGHRSPIFSVNFSPDGKILATGSQDGEIIFWNVAEGTVVGRISTGSEGSGVVELSFSPNGAMIAARVGTTQIGVWDTQGYEKLFSFDRHTGTIWSFDFSPDSSMLLTGSEDKSARLWSLDDGREIAVLTGHEGLVGAVSFLPDGLRVATGSHDGTVGVWSIETGQEIMDPFPMGNAVRYLGVSEDGRFVVASGGSQTKVWNLETGEEFPRAAAHQRNITSLSIASGGNYIMTTSEDQTARITEVSSAREILRFSSHKDTVLWGSIHPNLESAVTASRDGTARIWSLSGPVERVTFQGHRDSVFRVLIDPRGEFLISGSGDGTAIVRSLPEGAPIGDPFDHGDGINDVNLSPLGSHLATAGEDGQVKIWDMASREMFSTLSGDVTAINSVIFSPDGSLVASGTDGGVVRIRDILTGQDVVPQIENNGVAVHSVDFSLDGELFLLSDHSGYVRVFSTEDGSEISNLKPTGWPIWQARFHPSIDDHIIVGSAEGLLAVYSHSSGNVVRKFLEDQSIIRDFVMSPDGQYVLSGSEDGSVRLWDANTGNALALVGNGTGPVYSVAISTENDRVAIGMFNSQTILWPIWPDPDELIQDTAQLLHFLKEIELSY